MKDNGSNARVTEEVMAKDKKKPVQQDEKMPAEAHETVEQNSAENRAENSEDNGGVTLSKDEFERAKAEIERMNAEMLSVSRRNSTTSASVTHRCVPRVTMTASAKL